MFNRFWTVVIGLALLALAGCAGGEGTGGSLRLPTAAPPTGAAQAPQAPAALPQTTAAAPAANAPAVGQTPLPPNIKPTSSVPTATPLPIQAVYGAGTDATSLKRPIALALTADGGFYVGDQIGVHLYDANGKYVKTLIKAGPDTGLRIAAALAVAPFGEVYVADTLSNTILRLKSDGQVAGKLGDSDPKVDGPSALEFDKQGNLFIVNQNSAEVYKLDPNGKLLMKFGGKGEQNGQFLRPRGLALDKDGNIYVTDLTTYLIQKFSPDGKYVKSFGNQRGGENGWFLRGMDVGPDGRLYVVDGAQQRIQVFNLSDLTLVKEFQNPGRDPGQFQDPEDLRVDAQGNILIADKGNNRVQKLKLSL